MPPISLRHASSLLILIAALLFTACSQSATGDDPIPPQELRAIDLLQSEDVMAALRVDLGEVEEFQPLLEQLADATGLPEWRRLARASADPIRFLADEFDLPNDLPALSRDRAAYILFSHRGNEIALTASRLGLPSTPEEWPNYLNLRVLLPTDNPTQLASEFEAWTTEGDAEENQFDGLVFEGGDFLRLELAMPLNMSEQDGDSERAWLAGLNLEDVHPPATVDARATPAFEAFVNEDAPAAIWLPLDALTSIAVLEMNEIFRREYEMVGPAGKPRFHLEGVARIAASALALDPVSAENEDATLLLSANEAGNLIFDVITSRTARGVAIHQSAKTPIDMPIIAANDPLVELHWQGDFQALADVLAEPLWASIRLPDNQTSFESIATRGGGVMPADPRATVPMGAAFLQYPMTFIYEAVADLGAENYLPRALSLKAFPAKADLTYPLNLGVALAALYPNTAQNRAQIEQALAMLQVAIPITLDATLVERDDQYLEVRIVAGAPIKELFPAGEGFERVGTTTFSANLDGLSQRLPIVPNQQALNVIRQLHLRSGSDDAYASFRVLVGGPNPSAPLQLSSQVEALKNPTTRCETEIAAAAVERLRDLRTDAAGQVESWIDDVESRAGRCVEPTDFIATLISDRLELARQRSAEIP